MASPSNPIEGGRSADRLGSAHRHDGYAIEPTSIRVAVSDHELRGHREDLHVQPSDPTIQAGSRQAEEARIPLLHGRTHDATRGTSRRQIALLQQSLANLKHAIGAHEHPISPTGIVSTCSLRWGALSSPNRYHQASPRSSGVLQTPLSAECPWQSWHSHAAGCANPPRSWLPSHA